MASPEAIFSVLAMVLKEPKMPLQSAKHRITKTLNQYLTIHIMDAIAVPEKQLKFVVILKSIV